MKTHLLASGAGLLAILALASPAVADTPSSLVIEHVAVHHGDLDLTSEAGAGAMLVRLNDAASAACGRQPRPTVTDPLGPSKQRAWRLCKVAAVDHATLRLDSELVRALWLGNSEAIRYGDAARRTSAELYRQAGLEAPAAPALGG